MGSYVMYHAQYLLLDEGSVDQFQVHVCVVVLIFKHVSLALSRKAMLLMLK